MSRTRISGDLGALPRASALKSANDNARSLGELLKSLALKNQREQPRVFYSLREVATHFKVAVSTVSRIYHDLEDEGLLSRVRSSKTILNGLRHNRKLSVRAFVGLPVLTSHFITMPEYRAFFLCIRRELWLRGFAASTFFFQPDEAADRRLSDELKSFGVDTVIWLQPGRTAVETFLRLSDMGIRIIGISQVGTPGIPARYYVWKNRAIEALLVNWKDKNRIRNITVVDSKEYRSPVTEELLRVAMQHLGVEAVIQTFQGKDSSLFLSDLCHSKTTGIIFPSASLTSMFAFRSPEQMADLMRAQHVAFIDGAIEIPFSELPDVVVDLVTVNWQSVAETITSDLITRAAFERNRYTTFEADAQLEVSLDSFSEEMRPTKGIAAAV